MSSTTTSAPAVSSTASSSGGGTMPNNPNSQSRTLLFFVALGFGVVFTNLWIIVGVKYCFRYNQRARQLAAMDADGVDGMDMNNMPRPRRRREKKLMTMDEVNTRFPLIKYKLWRASREQEGLPAAGGVTAPPSRAPSIKETMGFARTSTDARDSIEEPATHHDTYYHNTTHHETANVNPTSGSRDFATPPAEGPSTVEHHEKLPDSRVTTEMHNVELNEEDEDDPIRTAVPAELLAEPGDSCAICIDNLDDDDEVRGLTCGHAFHAACLDPWLTSRRACCPLCKADYYIPRPRPEGETVEHRHRGDRNTPIAMPGNVWIGGRGIYARPRILIAGSRFTVDNDRYGFPVLVRDGRHGQGHDQVQDTEGGAIPGPGRMSRLRNVMFSSPSRGMPWLNVSMPRHQAGLPAQSEAHTTPGQMEAGQR